MTDQDFLIPGRAPDFGSGVIGVCDVCGRRQAVIVLQKERFQLCVLDFLNKTWSTAGRSPGAPLPAYRSERIWFPTRTEPSGRAPAIVLSPTKLAKRPIVLVTPDVYGLTTTLLDGAIRLARDGFEVLLPDLARSGRGGPGDHLSMRFGARTRRGVPVTSPRISALVSLYRDGLEFLKGREMVDAEKVAVFGVSYGASLASRVASLEPLVAAVGLAYPIPVRPVESLGSLTAPTLVIRGSADADAARFVEELRVRRPTGAPLEVLELPGADHGFLARDLPAYRIAEAERAWTALSEFFRKQLLPPPPKPPPPPVVRAAPTAPAATPAAPPSGSRPPTAPITAKASSAPSPPGAAAPPSAPTPTPRSS